jgi:hypothetical protein
VRASGRKLVVDGVEYRWTCKHGHRVGPEERCQESVTAWQVGRENAPLVVRFVDGRGCIVDGQGPWGHLGGVFVGDDQINLNLPSVAVALIRAGLRTGWDTGRGKPHVIEDAAAFAIEHRIGR